MAISINLGAWGSVFAVPACIADEHIKIASELQLKVILYLLRNSGKSPDYADISEALGANAEDVKDSVDFWVDRGVLCKDGDELSPAAGSLKSPEQVQPITEKPVRVQPVRAAKPDIYTAAQRVSADEKLQALLAEAELALSKPLSSGDTATIVMLYDTCGMPAEVVIMLVNYCVSVGKGNMRTIERIGVQWADSGVNSIEAAENRILQIKRSNANWSVVRAAFGLKNVGSPTKKQLEYGDLWVGQWHFSEEMLTAAYEACVDSLGKLSMSYINKILQRWNNAGIYTVKDISKLDSRKPSRKKSDASYDIADLEKIQ